MEKAHAAHHGLRPDKVLCGMVRRNIPFLDTLRLSES
jgi:hypothetical protein